MWLRPLLDKFQTPFSEDTRHCSFKFKDFKVFKKMLLSLTRLNFLF